ncbi:MAG: autotransporter-associated beta strand repeat-containing protein [Kiritimatiellia bacterium]|jgi:autotransporter-associated beta strand protein|nr:autotransporter-associated beta strand repeat-containing protein [Kiritimatiellia bacterium]
MSDWGTADPGYRKLLVEDFAASFNDFDDRVVLTWTDSEGETGYVLWRSEENSFATASNIAPDIGADEIDYNDEDAVTGTIYYYWLQATNEYSGSVSDPQSSGAIGRRAQVPPMVTTLPISNNILNSAMSGGDILDAGGSAITNRGVVWNTDGLPTITDSHTPEVTISGGGLGTYASTITPTIGGIVYYVRAFAQNEERIAYGQQVSFVAECSSELPTTLAATDIGPTSFTANWNAMDGVSSYRLDVSTNATFLGGYDDNVAAWHNGTLGEGTGGTWTEENLLQSAGYVALRGNTATLGTPAMDFNASTAETLTFKARIFGGGGNGDFRNKITVSISTDDGATWESLGTRTPLNTTMTPMEPFDLSHVAGTKVRVRLQTLSSGGGIGAGVVDMMVTNILDPRGVYISGYSNRTVDAATSLLVTDLLPEVTYYYRVRAHVSENCISGNSDIRPVVTSGYSAYWDSGGSGRFWTTAGNWVGDELPRTNSTVYFYADNKTQTNVYLNGNQTVKGLRFTDNASTSVNIASNSLTIFGGGIDVALGAEGFHGIHSDIVVAEEQTWGNSANVDFRVSGSVMGSRDITKTGAGRIVLAGHGSTFSGEVLINEGALQIRGTNALGTTVAGTTVADGAALEVHGGGSSVRYAPEPLTLAGTGIANAGALRFLQNNVDFRGPITLAADARVQAVLNSPTASGSIDIGAHTLYVGVDGTELTLGGNLTGTRTDGDGAFVKDGPSRLILSGNNTNLTGVFRFNEGEIRIGTANAMGNTGMLVLGNNVVMKSASVADVTISRPVLFAGHASFGEETTRTGTLTFESDVDLGGAMRTITVNHPVTKWTEFMGTLSNGGLTKAGAGLLVLSGTNVHSGGTTVSDGILQGTTDSLPGNIINNAAVVFSQDEDGAYSSVMSGSGTLTKNGTGTLTLSGVNTHKGLTMLNEGLLVVSGSAAQSPILVGGGAHLMGTGTIDELFVDGTVHPGASSNTVGILKASNVFLSPGGALRVDMTDAAGTAGTGWDLIDCTGDITVDATEQSPFTVQVVGAPSGFTAAVSKSWKIIDASAGVVNGFAANKFTVDATGFTSAMGGGGFTVTENGGDLYLEFQIPGIAVLGTNGTTIAKGSTAVSLANGTDFGSVSINSADVRTFVVTNTGGAELSLDAVTIDGDDFVVVAANELTVAAGDTTTFTIAYTPQELGPSAATVSLANGIPAFSPYTFALAGNGLIMGPTNLLVRNDGYEMIRLTWNKAEGFDGMIVHRANEAPTDPTQDMLYNVGDSCGGGRVLYKGPLEEFEHVVPANSANYYAVYSVSTHNEYSAAARGFDITEAFETTLSYDPFSYTNGVALAGRNGGVGWGGAWNVASGLAAEMGQHSLMAAQGFGTEQGNQLISTDLTQGSKVEASRALSSAYVSSDIYLGWVMNVPAVGGNRYAGVEVYGGQNGTTPLFQVGVISNATQASVQYLGGSGRAVSSIPIVPGEDYTFIAKFVKKDKRLHLLAYTTNGIVSPEANNEPSTWHATLSISGMTESFRGIRLVASNGTATAGAVKWDEIRVAKSWTNLFSEARAPIWKGSTGLLKSQWVNAFNWVGNQLPWQTNDTCVFYRSLPYTGDISVVHLGSLYNYKGLKFNENADINVNIRPVDYNLWLVRATNGLGLFANGIEIMEGSEGTHSLGNMTVRADQTWNNASPNVFTLAGYIKGNDYAVTKAGTGRIHLVGDNSSYFTGNFTVQEGAMSIGAHKSLGTTTANGWTAVEPGGALELRPTGATTYDPESLRLAGLGVANDGALRNMNYNNTWQGEIILKKSARINADATTLLTLTGGINAADDDPHSLYFGGAGGILVNNKGIGTNVLEFIKDGTGTATLARATAHSGSTWISNGTLRLTLANALPPATFVQVEAGAIFDHTGTSQTIGSLSGAGTVQLGAARLITGGNGSNTTWSGSINGTGGVDKRGGGVMEMAGVNPYSGSTTVDNGTLMVSGSSPYSAHAVQSAGTLMGDGPIGALSIAATVDPGNAVGVAATLEAGAVTLQPNGIFKVDMTSVTGTAGVDWDLLNSYAGITSLPSGTFVIKPAGNPANFDSSQNYSWTIMSGVSPVSGFNVNRFIVDATDFWPSLDGGLFSVNVDDNNLNLIFTTGSGIPVWDGEGEDANWDTGINWEGDIAPMGEKVVYFYTGLYSGPTIQLNGIRSVRGLRLTDQADESLTFAGTRLNINSAGIAIDANSEGAHALACMVQLSADQTWTNDSALPFTARGMISGAQQLRKAGSGLVVLAANNTFSGGLYVDQGGVQLHSSTNAMGDGGVTVGANATLELNGAFNWRPSATLLYGTGTNGGGALRQISSGLGEWRGDVTLGADSAIAVPVGTFNTYGNLAAETHTLYITNTYGFTMMAGQMTGTKVDGDGALHKSGPGNLFLRGETLAGRITVAGGPLRLVQDIANSAGTLVLQPGAVVSAGDNEARTVAKPVVVQGAVALGARGAYSGALTLANGLDLADGQRAISVSNVVTVSGPIANGGLIKMAAGTMTVAAANTYLGPTTVSEGTLVVNGGSVLSAHTVDSGAVLRGNGTVGALSIHGTVDPGASDSVAGQLSVAGDVTLNDGGILRVDMPSATGTAGTDWDLLVSSDAIVVHESGDFAIELAGAAVGFNPGINQSWKIMDGTAMQNFHADRFWIDTSRFEPATYNGTFSVTNDEDHSRLYLSFQPSVESADLFSVTVRDYASMNLTFEPNGAGQEVVIVYNTTGVFTEPSGTLPDLEADFAGGKVAYVGSDSPQLHQGLTSCTRYYYAMFSTYDNRYSAALLDDDMTSPPLPPVVLEATNITANSFYANWEEVQGASNYRLDVSESPYFTSGSAGAVEHFLFQGFEGTDSDNWSIFNGNTYVSSENHATDSPASARIRTGEYSWQRVRGQAELILAQATIAGYSSRTVEVHVASISTNKTNGAEITDQVKIYAALDGAAFGTEPDITISGAAGSNARWGFDATGVVATVIGTPVAVAAPQAGGPNENNYATARISIPDSANTLALKIVVINNAAAEVWAIDDVLVSGKLVESQYVPGFDDLEVVGLTQQVTGLTENVTYYYRVRAESDGGCTSGNSDIQPVITTTDVPDEPLNLTASDGTSADHVELEWSDVATETGYHVYRGTSAVFVDAELIHINAMNVTNWFDATATPGQLYHYWISGVNQNGEGAPSAPDTGYRLLGMVMNVAASQGTSSNHVTVTWNDIDGGTDYNIWRSLDHNTNNAECVGTVSANTETFDDTTAIPGWDYHYWLEAANSGSASTGAWSSPSAVGFRMAIVNPTATLVLDGREMVRAAVTANSTDDPIIVLHSTTGPVLAYPGPYTNTYAAGDIITIGTNTATVAYKGDPANFQEHVVAANTTNHYRIFSIQTDTYYSDGLIVNGLISSLYPAHVYSETFSYTNRTLNTDGFAGKNGGYLWDGAWSLTTAGEDHGWSIQTDGIEGLPAWTISQPNYPTVVGNRAVLNTEGVGHNAARRAIAPTNSGTIYVGAIVAYQFDGDDGANKYMTIGLMNDTTTEFEFGKVFGRKNFFDIRRNDANGTVSTYEMHGWGESGRSTNDWYWMVVKYDFNAGGGTAYANCYYQGQNIPYDEPTSWDAEWSGMGITQIDGIELKGGSGISGYLGAAIWDEIRISSVWPSLIGQPNLLPWPSPVDFGEVESTLSSNITVWIANSGGDNVPLDVTGEPAFELIGDDASYFSLSINRFDDNLTLGDSNSVVVSFWPTNSGTVAYTDAWLMVENNSGVDPYPIPLIGTGIPTVSSNLPMVSNYFVGDGHWVTDAMVTSGVFAVAAEVFHVRGIRAASYDLINGDGETILADQPFDTWTTTDGVSYVLSDATHPGYWPATPSENYQLRVNLESSNLVSAVQTIYTADGVVTASDLFFSEYVEGLSNNKALEIYNGTGAAVDLSQYGIRFKVNNSAEWDANADYRELPEYTLEAGATFVIAHPGSEESLLARANYVDLNICNFTGDDSIFLFKGIGEEDPLDAIGASPSGGNFAMDTTLYRLASVTHPAAVYNALEWTNLAAIVYTNLGEHVMDGAEGRPMAFAVDDDDVENPEIEAVSVAGMVPSESAPGPDIILTNLPPSGLALAWTVQDVDSGMFAASNQFTLQTGLTVVASGYVTAGSDGDGKLTPLPVSINVPKNLLPFGDYELIVSGVDYDPEFEADSLETSRQVFFRILSPAIDTIPESLDFGQVGVGLTSNLTLVVTNSGNAPLNIEDITFSGTGFAFFEADIDSLTVEAGSASNMVVSFIPTGGGTFNWTMTLHNDSGNASAFDVPLTGSCFDPETMPPEIVGYAIEDNDDMTGVNKVTDHAAVHGELSASFTLYHLLGVEGAGASFDLLYPNGTFAAENVPLVVTSSVTNDGAVCSVFTGVPPSFYPAILGVYTARVTAVSSNGIPMTDEVRFSTSGGGVQQLVETFNDVANNSGTYASGIATNADWGVWSFTQTRWDLSLSGKAPTVRAGGTLTSPLLSDGCTQIKFDYKRPFSESGTFDLDVLVNGDVVDTVTAMPPNTTTIYTHQIDGLDFSGEVSISFVNKGSANKRITIDNLSILTLGTETSEIMTIQVVDEDTTGPVHSGFSVDGALFTTHDFLPDGLVVTGLVGDAQSGVYATSNTWTLYSNSTAIADGVFTMDPATDGAGISNELAALSVTIPGNLLDWVNGQFKLDVTSTDYDHDRPDDWKQSTTTFTFGISEYVPVPNQFVAVADGPEMIEMSWKLNEAPGVLLLWSTNPITAGPVKGTDYTDNRQIGNATVVYIGSAEALEVVVPPESINYFRLYGRAGLTYSADYAVPVTDPVETLKYEKGEIVDQFAYTNGVTLAQQAGLATGQGWNGAWFGDDLSLFTVEDTNLVSGGTGYPTPYANKLQLIYNSDVPITSRVYRALAMPRSARTFVAFMMNYKTYDYEGANKFIGLSLMSGPNCETEEIFFGKPSGAGNKAGIFEPDTDHEEHSATYSITADHLADYMIVGEWEPEDHTIRMWAFYHGGEPIPETYEEATPIAVYSNPAINAGTITGIRLAAGISAEGVSSLDHAYFDEIRVGGTWDEVLNFTYPKVYDYALEEESTWVSDGQLAQPDTNYPVAFTVYHRTKVKEAAFNLLTLDDPQVHLYDSNQEVFLDDAQSGTRQVFTNLVTERLDPAVVELTTYTARVWVTSTSLKETNTITLAEQGGADDLFFGEFGSGNYWDKYVEVYNGTGTDIDLSQYIMASQTQPEDKYATWTSWSMLSEAPRLLPHGETIAILNGGRWGSVSNMDTVSQALVDAMNGAGRPYIFTSNYVLRVSGDDPVGLFHISDTNKWIDVCGIAPEAKQYIMQRQEDAEVPWYYPERVDTNQWDFRVWDGDAAMGYTNITATAGVYDRLVGMGGFIQFNVYDDDTDVPTVVGANSVLKIGKDGTYTDLEQHVSEHEVVFCAWSFTNSTVEEAAQPWGGSLLSDAAITWTPVYTDEVINLASGSGSSENDVFDGYGQIKKGELYLRNVGGTHWDFGPTNVPWIQFDLPLVAAEDIVFSWAEAGGAYSFTNVSVQWSDTGEEGSFVTNAAWPSWTMTDLRTAEWRTRFIEFTDVVPSSISRVYLRFVLGPGHGGATGNTNGAFRMDNIQLFGRPFEYRVTDRQIAQSGYGLRMSVNVFDESGIQADLATMAIGNKQAVLDVAKSQGDGFSEDSTLWWKVSDVSREELTEWVLTSDTGAGISMPLVVPDADMDRANDASTFIGSPGRLRVVDNDVDRPKLTLTSMKPLSSILAQWAQMTNTASLFPTKSDAGVEAKELKTKSGAADPKSPTFSRTTANGYHYIEAFAWQGGKKCWLVEVTPEADMALTNLTFTSCMHRTNGVSHYRIDHYVNGALKANILGETYWVYPPAMLDPNAWYPRSHSWDSGTVVLEAGKINQIRIYGLGSSNIGARWRISELTLWQETGGTEGVTEVTDAEFTSESFMLTGHAWDTGSGIASTNHTDPAKRPMFSMNAPDGGVLVSNRLFTFIEEVLDGGATTQEEGAFKGLLPTPVYTNVMLGEYTGEAQVWDHDNDRTFDDLKLQADLALYVVDNDIGEPTAVGGVRVNGMLASEMTRETAPWTNTPEFMITMDSVAEDRDPGDDYSDKQRTMTGIGEYRVTTANISTMLAGDRANYGVPYPVAATNGALANYGFEMWNLSWATDANSRFHRYDYQGDPTRPIEGTNCLKQTGTGEAYQWIALLNTNAVIPKVGVSGRYRIDSGASPTLRIQAFTADEPPALVATRDIPAGTSTSWASFNAVSEAIGDSTVAALKITLIGNGSTTYWDDIRLGVDIGDNRPSMRFIATAANQGISTSNYLFAVDADNNRIGDRLGGEPVAFAVPYDITPPTSVGRIGSPLMASTETVDDPTTQFDLEWSTHDVGPDDPGHINHPTKTLNDRDILSPWQTYKIYYGSFNVLQVPDSDPGAGSADAYIYTNFIATGTYKTWSNRVWNSEINDPSAPAYQATYHALTNASRNTIRLYDLDFDQDYAVIIVGVDKAGNEGPAGIYSWATNNTIKFSLTRGWALAKTEASTFFPDATLTNALASRAAGLAWTASGTTNPLAGSNVKRLFTEVKKDYDLIYWDAPSFRENKQNDWKLLGTVRSNWFVDDGGQGRQRGNLRFYRASYKDRWKKTRQDGTNVIVQRPIASEEIYAMHNVVLSPGQNFVALHGVPYTNTFEAVFGGTETFPGGDETSMGATKVEFFSPGVSAESTEQFYLNADGRWYEMGGAGLDVTTNVMAADFFNRGFSITLPNILPATYVVTNALDYNQADDHGKAAVVNAMIWSPIAQVPTNGFSQVIYCGSTEGRIQTLKYNVVALRLPVATHPSRMRLLESGFVSGYRGLSDEIYTMNTATKSPLENTKIYCDEEGVWRFTRNKGLVPYNFFQPNDVIVIISRNWVGSGSWTWTYHPQHFYPNEKLPDRWMGN